MTDIEIIAEIGVNHNGNINTAVALMNEAKKAECDTVKFQLWDTKRVYPRGRWEEMKLLELSHDDIARLKGLAEGMGLRFLCTPDDVDDALFLKRLGVKRIKIGSSNVTNFSFLQNIAKLDLPVVLSTGACSEEETDSAIDCFKEIDNLTVMHCVSSYPSPPDQLNLRVIKRLACLWGESVVLGFSDHTIGRDAALVALGLGARVFEKHLTLDRDQRGPDHAASIEPYQMSNYGIVLRDAAAMLGDGVKRIMQCELENRKEYERFVAQQRGAGVMT